MLSLEHKIEEDFIKTTGLHLSPKLTYNKMCSCTIIEEEKRKKNQSSTGPQIVVSICRVYCSLRQQQRASANQNPCN